MQPITEIGKEGASDKSHMPELRDVEALTNELKRLLVRHEKTLNEEGIRREVEVLERWLESCRRGLAAADKISGTGMEWLTHIRNHLKLAAEELHRLESEGGNPPSKEQAEKTEELIRAVGRIDKLMPDFEQIFHHAPQVQEEKEDA